jgi:hypothetical protein
MTGIALATSEIPLELQPRLRGRLHEREGEREYQFHYWQKPTVLPVLFDGQMRFLQWGSQQRTGSMLPVGGWVEEDRVPTLFASEVIEKVLIPANLGFDRGVWFVIDRGVQGVVVMPEGGQLTVYMLMTKATNYYRNMTQQAAMMPVLYGQVI